MNFRNNIYVEVMHAHFNHYLTYYSHEPLNSSKENPLPPIHGYPDDFFKIFELLVNPTDEKQRAVNAELEKLLEANADQFPELGNTAKPQVKYNSILGIRMNLKQIKVGHPDARVTTVTYRYRFYKLHYVFLFLFTRDKMRRAHIYNNHLKKAQRDVYPEIFPLVKARQNNQPVKVNEPLNEGEIEKTDTNVFTDASIKNTEFTVRRQCILVLHILKAMKIDLSMVNYTDIAKLIHALSAKEIPADRDGNPIIDNSYIYKTLKKLRKKPDTLSEEDLIFIKKCIAPFDIESKNPVLKKMVKQLEINTL